MFYHHVDTCSNINFLGIVFVRLMEIVEQKIRLYYMQLKSENSMDSSSHISLTLQCNYGILGVTKYNIPNKIIPSTFSNC